MADLEGSHTLDIDAPIDRVFEIVADVERAPEWQGTMRTVEVLERDAEGRPELIRTQIDSSVAKHDMQLRFSYEEPTTMRWRRESGDLKSLEGHWRLEEAGDGRTRATYALEIGLNRGLGLLAKGIKGPARSRMEHLLARRPVEGLKERAESG